MQKWWWRFLIVFFIRCSSSQVAAQVAAQAYRGGEGSVWESGETTPRIASTLFAARCVHVFVVVGGDLVFLLLCCTITAYAFVLQIKMDSE